MPNSMQVVIESLHVFPIKACAAVHVEQLVFTAQGRIRGDREWAVVDAERVVVWQGSHPRLALMQPSVDGDTLILRSGASAPVAVVSSALRPVNDIRIWNDSTKRHDVFAGHDAGDAAAAILSTLTGSALRLVRLGPEALVRDGSQRVHLVSRASWQALNDELAQQGLPAAEMARFRPNVVLAEHGETLWPFIEEQFSELGWIHEQQSGAFVALEPCVRCVVPNVDPRSGGVAAEPLRTMATLSAQRLPGQPVCFGVYARPAGAGTLPVGAVLTATLNF